jgi:DNA repair protein SbcD/Mre11
MRVFLTSDLHLGMKFARYPETVQATLTEARFACLERMVGMAGAEGCDLLVIAGDLFERVAVARRDVQRAVDALAAFSGKLVALMPGNHDFIAPGDTLWPGIRDSAPDTVLLLDEPRPYPLAHYDMDACLYPGPCTAKHAATNAIGWVKPAPKSPGVRHHIGVAHGSLAGFSPDMDGQYYPMTSAELQGAGVGLWLLGHTHVPFPETPTSADRIFCAGTPEPDGLDSAHEGGAWILDVEETGSVAARRVRTGAYRFRDETRRIAEEADIATLAADFADEEARRTVLRLRLEGRVSREARAAVGELETRLAGSLLHLDLRTEGLRERLTPELIDAEYPAGSFPHALLTRLAASDDTDALEIAHDLLREVRS